jgi:hypothetical protein
MLQTLWTIAGISSALAFKTNGTEKGFRRAGLTALYDDMTDTEEGRKSIFYFDEVSSTMEKVKYFYILNNNNFIFDVV